MATLEKADVSLQIAGIMHVFYADVDTAPLNLDNFVFADPKTHGSWVWLGDVSSENVIEVDTDGGEQTEKRTHDRTGVRTATEDVKYTMTINSVALNEDTFKLGFGATYNASRKSYIVTANPSASSKALLLVVEDTTGTGGLLLSGFYLPRTSITGSFPKVDIENFTEVPLSAVLQPSLTQTSNGQPVRFEVLEPRKYSPAAPGG